MKIFPLDREGTTHELAVHPGDVLMEVLRDAGLGIEAVCGGCCACATCHVFLKDQALIEARGEDEEALLSVSDHFDPARSRLSCQIRLTQAHDGLSVIVAPED